MNLFNTPIPFYLTLFAVAISLCSYSVPALGQAPDTVAGIPVNYQEDAVGNYTLPDPLLMSDGTQVQSAQSWYEQRRPEILRMFEQYQYGETPGRPDNMRFDLFDTGTVALGGSAIRKQVTIYFTGEEDGPKMDLLIYLPPDADEPVPLFFNLGFTANSSIFDDPGIKRGTVWRSGERVPAPESSGFGGFDIEPFLESGIGVATVYYGDIEPDFLNGVQLGIRGAYLEPGQEEPAPDEWGAISAWAWGLSRAMDYIETDESIDSDKVALMGVSRLGKTVLWAGARDPRFAMVIASCSGEGGAALSRRNFGETIAHLTAPTRYPYQFAGNYQNFSENVDQFPVDAHMLISLIAPRPVFLQTGDEDLWSDPRGEFLAAVAAEPVYNLLGETGLDTDRMPAVEEPIMNTIGYHMHDGGHGTRPVDWDLFLEFMQMHFQE